MNSARRRAAAARRRRGVTLLELVLAGTLTAAVTGGLHVAVRGMTAATAQLSGEDVALRHADAGLRFIVRRCRESRGVASVDAAGAELRLAVDGGTLTFFPTNGGRSLNVRDSRAGAGNNRTLMDDLASFTPAFYAADGVTPTADPAAVRVIEITLTVDLPRDHAAGRTVSSRVWVRPW